MRDDDAVPLYNAQLLQDKAVDILLHEYDAMRTEIRVLLGIHEKVSFWLSSGLVVVTAACFKEEFAIGFAFLPLVILAYYAHRLHRFTLGIATLSRWVMRTEDLIDKLLGTDGLLEWERSFARQRMRLFSFSSIWSLHYLVEGFLLLPSLVVFLVCLHKGVHPLQSEFGISLMQARFIMWGVYPLMFAVLWGSFFAMSGSTHLDEARHASANKAYQSVLRRLSQREDTTRRGSEESTEKPG